MDDAERIVTELSRDFHKLRQIVEGNGDKSNALTSRVRRNEVSITKIIKKLDEHPCIPGCQWRKYMEEEKAMRDKRRGWRIGDIANYLQLAIMLIMLYGLYKR